MRSFISSWSVKIVKIGFFLNMLSVSIFLNAAEIEGLWIEDIQTTLKYRGESISQNEEAYMKCAAGRLYIDSGQFVSWIPETKCQINHQEKEVPAILSTQSYNIIAEKYQFTFLETTAMNSDRFIYGVIFRFIDNSRVWMLIGSPDTANIQTYYRRVDDPSEAISLLNELELLIKN